MNNNEKIEAISRIINAGESNLCPYCFGTLESVRKKDTGDIEEHCHNHDEGTLHIRTDDYLDSIVHIVKYSEPKKIISYKKITEF